jgi:hypothetical protein
MKNILKLLDHTFPMFCVLVFIMSIVAFGVAISAGIIDDDVRNSDNYIEYRGFKDERVNTPL